jgi:integrase
LRPATLRAAEHDDGYAVGALGEIQHWVSHRSGSAAGKRQQVRRRFATEKQARDALAEIGPQAATDQFVPRKAVTVEELCADWLASLHNARATTINAYRYAIAPHRERHGDLPLQKLARPDRLLIGLRGGGSMTAKGHPRRPWSPRSLNKAVDAWRAVLAYGIERRELARDVAAAMKKVPRIHVEMSTYTPDEIRRVLRAADKDRNGHLWYLALSGLRRGEIAGLRWLDVDLMAAPSRSRAPGPGGRGQRGRRRPQDTVIAAHAAAR